MICITFLSYVVCIFILYTFKCPQHHPCVHTHMHPTHTCTHMRTHTCARTHTHAPHMHTHTHTHAHTRMHTHTHTHTHRAPHTHTQRHTCKHTYIKLYILSLGTRSYKQEMNFRIWSYCYLEDATRPPAF